MGRIKAMANSSQKIYMLTEGGTLHSIYPSSELSAQTCIMTSIRSRIRQIVFPHNFSQVFACMCSRSITIFRTEDQKELLTINLQDDVGINVKANRMEFTADGRSIVTAWTDGKVRAFAPQSGKLIYIIKDAHSIAPHSPSIKYANQHGFTTAPGVTCLNTSANC